MPYHGQLQTAFAIFSKYLAVQHLSVGEVTFFGYESVGIGLKAALGKHVVCKVYTWQHGKYGQRVHNTANAARPDVVGIVHALVFHELYTCKSGESYVYGVDYE